MSDFGNEKIDRETLLKMAGSGALRLALSAAAATTLAACAKDTNETDNVAENGGASPGATPSRTLRGPMNLTHCTIFGQGKLTLNAAPAAGDGTYTVHVYKGDYPKDCSVTATSALGSACSSPFLHIEVNAAHYPVSCEYQDGTAPPTNDYYPKSGEKRENYHILVAFVNGGKT